MLAYHRQGSYDAEGRCIVAIDRRYFRPSEVDTLVGDSTKARTKLGWEPKTPLRVGLIPTYRWIEACVLGQLHQPVETAAE